MAASIFSLPFPPPGCMPLLAHIARARVCTVLRLMPPVSLLRSAAPSRCLRTVLAVPGFCCSCLSPALPASAIQSIGGPLSFNSLTGLPLKPRALPSPPFFPSSLPRYPFSKRPQAPSPSFLLGIGHPSRHGRRRVSDLADTFPRLFSAPATSPLLPLNTPQIHFFSYSAGAHQRAPPPRMARDASGIPFLPRRHPDHYQARPMPQIVFPTSPDRATVIATDRRTSNRRR